MMGLFARRTSRKRDRTQPDADGNGFQDIEFTAADGTPLRGWIYKASDDCCRGTVFLAHGIMDNSSSFEWDARELSAAFGVVALAFDHRMHGLSGNGIPTFGALEALDLQAAMDYADRAGLPAPYVLHGVSLGAMAAQRAGIADPRVRALFLEACPGWPRAAIASHGRWKGAIAGLAGTIVNYCYGRDVLEEGDIRAVRQPDGHDPFVCYVIGSRDHFGIENGRAAYAHWRGAGAENRLPTATPEARKWYWVVFEAVHPGAVGSQLWECQQYATLRREFYARVLGECHE